jgi:hypothetical protein
MPGGTIGDFGESIEARIRIIRRTWSRVAPLGRRFGRDVCQHDVFLTEMAVSERSERLDDRGSLGTRHCPASKLCPFYWRIKLYSTQRSVALCCP